MEDNSKKLWAILIVCLCVGAYQLWKIAVDFHFKTLREQRLVVEDDQDAQMLEMQQTLRDIETSIVKKRTGQDVENETK